MGSRPDESSMKFELLLESLIKAGWDLDAQIGPISATLTHSRLAGYFLLVANLGIGEGDDGPREIILEHFTDLAPEFIDRLPYTLLANVKGLVDTDISSGTISWYIGSPRTLDNEPMTFSAPVSDIVGYIPVAIAELKGQAEEKDRAGKKKKAKPKAKKSAAKVEEKEVKDQIDVEVSEASEPSPLPFELVPGADPNKADIIVFPVSEDGLLSGEASANLKWIGFEGPPPGGADLSAGYEIVEGDRSDKIVVFVVTRNPRSRVARLLGVNLPRALQDLSSENRLAGRVLYVPLLATEPGAIGLEAGLEVTMGAFRQALTDPNAYPARIIIDPPGGMTDEDLNQFRSRLPAPDTVLDPMGIDGFGSEGMSDAASMDPKLGFMEIARSFRHFIDEMAFKQKSQEDQQGSLMTIGLFGRWGTGKSTMIIALRKAFKDGFVQILLNAWKWDGKEDIHNFFRRNVLEQVRRQQPRLYLKFLMRQSVKQTLRFAGMLAMVAAFGVLTFAIFRFASAYEFLPSLSDDASDLFINSTVLTGTAGGALWAFYNIFFKGLRTAVEGAIEKFLTPEHARRLGREGLAATYKDIATVYQDNRPEHEKGKAVPPPVPFIFYIDDLDRCPPERVVKFIESIHSLTMAGCVIFLACDESYVSAALQAHYKKVADEHPAGGDFGRRFLGKIVQMPFRIPAVDAKGMHELGLTRDVELARQTAPIPKDGTAPGKAVQKPDDSTIQPETLKVDATTDSSHETKPKKVQVDAELLDLIPTIHQRPVMNRVSEILLRLENQPAYSGEDVLAFVVADRFFPEWLDKRLKGNNEEIATGLWNPRVSVLIREGIDSIEPDELEALSSFRIVRISEVLDNVIIPLTEPLRLTVREAKRLKNQLRIYLRIEPSKGQEEAECLAAFLLADWLDPQWLDVHLGWVETKDVKLDGRIGRLEAEAKQPLKELIPRSRVSEDGLRRWRASA